MLRNQERRQTRKIVNMKIYSSRERKKRKDRKIERKKERKIERK